MDKRSIALKATGWILSALILFSLVCPLVSGAKAAKEMTQVEKLGSPLLDTAFTTDSWNPKELAVWGIYLSNFAVPLIDNYQTAFSKDAATGSKGRGLNCIMFGTDSTDDVTRKLVEYAANVQNESSRQVYRRRATFSSGVDATYDEWQEATLADFIRWEGNADKGTDVNSSGNNTVHLLEFGIKKTGEGEASYQTVFNCANGYDASMLAACYAQAYYNNNYGSDFKQAFEDYDTGSKKEVANNTKLKMDTFGNLVAYIDGRNIVVFPSCLNQYMTESPTYNFINSTFVSGSYNKLTSTQMSDSVERGKTYEDDALARTPGMRNGTIALGHSSRVYSQISVESPYTTAKNVDGDVFKNVNNAKERYKDFDNGTVFNAKAWADCVMTNWTDKNNTGKSPLKVFIKGAGDIDTHSWPFSAGSLKQLVDYIHLNAVFMDASVPSLLDLNIYGKDKRCIFDPPTVISNGRWRTKDINKKDHSTRRLTTFLGKVYNNNYRASDSRVRKYTDLSSIVTTDTTPSSLFNDLCKDSGKTSVFFAEYIKDTYGTSSSSSEQKSSVNLLDTDFNDYGDTIYSKVDMPSSFDNSVVSLYGTNSVFQGLSAQLSCNTDDDSELTLMCKSMYYTYLCWYGVLTSEYTNKLNPFVFTSDSDIFKKNVSDFLGTDSMSDEDKKKEVLNRTYLMLDPEKGRDLRKQIYTNSFTDTIFDWYSKAVYGSANYSSTPEKEGGVAAGKTSQGFLGVSNYYSNPFTSWFINIYDDIALVIMGVGIIVILVVWLLFRKKAIWILTSLSLLVTVVLITPSVGDIVPYACDKVISGAFDNQLEYWALCENVSNMQIENNKDLVDINGDPISADTAALLTEFNMNYADRALMLKYDISRKVTSSGLSNMSELQSLKTTAWILPQLLRQFSSEDGNSDYVYIPMSDALRAARQLYGAYVPRSMSDINVQQIDPICDVSAIRSQAWADVKNQQDYGSFGVSIGTLETMGLGVEPLSTKTSNPIHETFFYLADDSSVLHVPSVQLGYNADGKRDEPSVSDATANEFRTFCETMERTGGLYNNLKNNTVERQYGYMWTTESPLIYMYFNMKDTYINYLEGYSSLSGYTTTDENGEILSAVNATKIGNTVISEKSRLKSVVDMIQGEYIASPDGSCKNRANFMYDGLTGKTKDFMDIRNLLSNVAPYMYKTQIIAGGLGGKDGVFGEEKISLYPIYKNNYKSWMFRCNWADKLFNNKEYNNPYKITVNGSRVDVKSQIIPQRYEELGRPMVCSEAEMDRLGLKETDLSIVELKCIEANKQTAKDITMLLNYVNMDGLTTEALVQQMSLIATMNFCRYLSPDNGFNNQMAVYPQSVDLRNISFDAVARIMMLGATNDSYYTYGNTMYNMIANSDILSIILLLITAVLCVQVIPFIRNILMALLLFLGLWSTLTNFVAGDKVRWRITASYILNLLIFLASNVMFYVGMAMIMNMSSPTDILRDGTVGVSVQSPAIVLLILMALCILFTVCAVKQIIFTLKNYKDMGATMFGVMLSGLGDKIVGGLSSLKEHLSGGGTKVTTESGGTVVDDSRNTKGDSGRHRGSGSSGGSGGSGDSSDEETDETYDESEQSSAYTNEVVEDDTADEARDIDRKVEDGKNK